MIMCVTSGETLILTRDHGTARRVQLRREPGNPSGGDKKHR